MITEEHFQRALDRRRSHWQTRLAFADWLQERGDPRAQGYRALARRKRWPKQSPSGHKLWHWWDGATACIPRGSDDLPTDWFLALKVVCHVPRSQRGWEHVGFATRREAEDSAALAFAELPALFRAELLKVKALKVRS